MLVSVTTICLILFIGAVTVIDRSGVDELPVLTQSVPSAQIDPYTLRSAQEGNAEAQLRLARLLLLDADRTKSLEAVRWLQSAAEKKNSAAMVELGKLYRSGFGVLQDYDKAVKLIQSAALMDDADGMLELGRLYRDGVGFTRDPVLAYVWFNRAAAAQHIEAVRDRDDVARGLTVSQLKDAQAQSPTADTASVTAKLTKDSGN